MICHDCGEGPATTPMRRVEAGIAVVERELCARCARSRGVQPEPVREPRIFLPLPGPVGHSGEPWIFPPEAVGPPPPPAPSFVATFDARGRVTSTQVARYPEHVDLEEGLARSGAAEAWLFAPPKAPPL